MPIEPITPRSDRELVASRHLPHSPQRVFDAFRDAEQLARWWGPNGFTNEFDEFDFSPGGAWTFTMCAPDGKRFANASRFTEIVEPSRVALEHTSKPHFFLAFELQDVDGGTLVVMRQTFDSSDECARIAKYAGDGNEQNLDRLQALLASTS